MAQTSDRAFSIGWVLVSYFMVAGFIILVSVGIGVAKLEANWTGYVTFGLGAALGGFFAARASPHYSLIESGLAGLLVVVSIVLFVVATPLGSVLSVAGSGALSEALILGVIAMGGGLAGGWLGEKSSQSSGVSDSPARWLGLSFIINLGTLWTALIILAALMLRSVDAGASFSLDDATSMLLASCALAAFSAGLFTQAVAPRRLLLASAGGTLLAYLGIGTLQGLALDQVGNMVMGGAVAGALGAILALLGALVAWAVVGRRVVAEQAA